MQTIGKITFSAQATSGEAGGVHLKKEHNYTDTVSTEYLSTKLLIDPGETGVTIGLGDITTIKSLVISSPDVQIKIYTSTTISGLLTNAFALNDTSETSLSIDNASATLSGVVFVDLVGV